MSFIKRVAFAAVFCIGLMLLVQVALDDFDERQAQARLEYFVSGCDLSEGLHGGAPEVWGAGSTIFLKHEAEYACCADVRVEMQREEKELKLFELNAAQELCECLCTYLIEAEVTGLNPGDYEVTVVGFKGGELLAETVSVN